jgi:hypothetical protein
VPTTGRYSIGGAGDFAARYEVTTGATRAGYTARDGELEITAADENRLEGTFRFVARRNCVGTTTILSCTAGPLPDDAPVVEIAGTFEAATR